MSMNEKSCNCIAHGCPMPGTTSTSTSGGSEWLCSIHFGKDASQWQPITVELNRVVWLVEAVLAIRRYCARPVWPLVYVNIKQEILLNQRSDLLCQKGESAATWAMRLDSELRAICDGKTPIPMMPAAEDPGATDSWNRVRLSMPEHA